jgi:peroxiredoxin Q/BCP
MKKGERIHDTEALSLPLKTADGTDTTLASYVGTKPCVLFFYPKAGTAVCTKEACQFRDEYSVFTSAGAEVVGISNDKPAALTDFAQAQRLNFPLLSDEGGKLRKALGVKGSLFGMVPGRVTYVFDKGGVCVLEFNNALNARKHVDEAIAAIKALSA